MKVEFDYEAYKAKEEAKRVKAGKKMIDIAKHLNKCGYKYIVVQYQGAGDSGDSSFAYAREYKNRTVYFLSFFRGNIYDPYGVYAHKRKSREIEFKKVTKQSFDLYLNYLDTRNRSFLTLAERKYVNG